MSTQKSKKPSPSPPKWPDRFLRRFCAPHLREEVMGDLHERYYLRVQKVGVTKAKRIYRREVIAYLRLSVFKRQPSSYSKPIPTAMIQNYFTIAMRNMIRYKGFSFINIAGLAIGIASFALIGLYVYHELSFDRYHKNAGNIYRIVEDLSTENELLFQATSAPPMGPAFAREYPEVVDFVRFSPVSILVTRGDVKFYEDKCYLADPSVFKVFSFPMIQGNPRSALHDPMTVVLTATTAEKYFGKTNPVGEALEMGGDLYKVTGVIADVPDNSHFTFDLLISFATFSSENKQAEETEWFWNDFYTYLLLQPDDIAVAKLRSNMSNFLTKYIGAKKPGGGMYYNDLPLQPLASIYLEKPRTWENGIRGSKENLYILFVIAVFILLIASFNYVNLATARASRRVKEVGLRKIMGAERKALIQQFLGESIIVSFLSMILGLIVAALLLPFFNNLLETALSFPPFNKWQIWMALFGLSIFLGTLAGAYPAFLVSGFHPLQIFRSTSRSAHGNSWLRKVLVSGQFTISITLIAGTLLIFDQLSLISELKLGFDKEKTLKVNFNGNEDIKLRLASVKNELLAIPGIKAVSAAFTVPGEPTTNRFSRVETEAGKMSDTNFNTFLVDHDFIPNFNIEVIAGRTFSKNFPADDSTAFVINETAAKHFGWNTPETAIGKRVWQQGKEGSIIGVVQDFHYKSLHHQIEPLLIHINRDWFRTLSLKIKSDNIPEVLAKVEKRWKSLAPNLPFVYSFLDQDYDRLYKAEKQLGKVVSLFSALAIFVACLGLLGLTSFSVERRLKEISIRKVLGASIKSLVLLISNEFFKLIILALFIAIPTTYYIINLWLENFASRIDITPWTFVIAGLLTLVIAWLVIGYLSVKAARSNPVDSLQNE
ncbi:ABC transporter permease [Fulvivirgaceae bacterium BMA12]|uniref:ABC transporter permease n=1 Tax=Agaribacillus aureus TaxID=3051825 RepID=A0ABT8LIM2_9BACT|nr:ABC transporter permease [Fulvivirgaceae bacterium BMA12]